MPGHEHRPRVVGRLQQPVDERRLERLDPPGPALEPDVVGDGRRRIDLRGAGPAGLLGVAHERLALVVAHPVELKHVVQLARMGDQVAALPAAQRADRARDALGDLCALQAGRLAVLAQPRPEPAAAHRRAVDADPQRGRGVAVCGARHRHTSVS
jgi:hypothetical protein